MKIISDANDFLPEILQEIKYEIKKLFRDRNIPGNSK